MFNKLKINAHVRQNITDSIFDMTELRRSPTIDSKLPTFEVITMVPYILVKFVQQFIKH